MEKGTTFSHCKIRDKLKKKMLLEVMKNLPESNEYYCLQ